MSRAAKSISLKSSAAVPPGRSDVSASPARPTSAGAAAVGAPGASDPWPVACGASGSGPACRRAWSLRRDQRARKISPSLSIAFLGRISAALPIARGRRLHIPAAVFPRSIGLSLALDERLIDMVRRNKGLDQLDQGGGHADA